MEGAGYLGEVEVVDQAEQALVALGDVGAAVLPLQPFIQTLVQQPRRREPETSHARGA